MIRVGIGGWVFAPWRGSFYPPGLPHAQELAFASRQLTSIEINATFYRTQSAASFRRWREQTPERFVFALKGPRLATHTRDLDRVGSAINRFLDSGIWELGDKLGPILWQFAKTARFDPQAFAAFLAILPPELRGQRLRHVVEVSHPSFLTAEFLALLRAHEVAVALVDCEERPMIEEVTADFVYARLRRSVASEPTGYCGSALDCWAARLRKLSRAPAASAAGACERDCFVYFISGAKVRAPAAARALIERLS